MLRPLNAYDLKTKLTDLGFDLTKYENPLANIHTAMTRMAENDKMTWVPNDEGEKRVLPGPELKPVPQPEPQKTLLDTLYGLTPTPDEKK